MAAGIAVPDYAASDLDACVYGGRGTLPTSWVLMVVLPCCGGPPLSLTSLVMNGGTAVIGMVMLGMMAYGTWRHGFLALFNQRMGRVVMALGWLDLMGLAC